MGRERVRGVVAGGGEELMVEMQCDDVDDELSKYELIWIEWRADGGSCE